MKNIFFLIFISFSLSLCALEKDFHYINKKFTNTYENANKSAAVASQAVYAEAIKIIQNENDWSMIQTSDGYQGWIKTSHYISRSTPYPSPSSTIGKVKNLWTHIFFEKSIKNSAPFITLPFGTEIEIDDSFEEATDGWIQIRMLDGNKYWAQLNEFTINPRTLSLDEMLIQAKTFIGIPYLWSGKSTFGFDCSGFVQTLYLLMGIQLPRDSRLQAEYIESEKLNLSSLKKGDLVFFSEDIPLKKSNEQNRVYHVGIYLEKNTFIHCFGENMFEPNSVQISHFQNQEWNDKFLYGKRIKFFNTNSYLSGNIMFEDKDNQSIKNQFLEQYAKYYTEKNVEGIGELLNDNIALFDPEFKWIKGKENVIDLLQKKIFDQYKTVSFEVINNYQKKSTSVAEFKVFLDDLIVQGVVFIEWDNNGKMSELRAYCNPQERYYQTR